MLLLFERRRLLRHVQQLHVEDEGGAAGDLAGHSLRHGDGEQDDHDSDRKYDCEGLEESSQMMIQAETRLPERRSPCRRRW